LEVGESEDGSGRGAAVGAEFAESAEEDVGDGHGDLLGEDGLAEGGEVRPARGEGARPDAADDVGEDWIGVAEMPQGRGPVEELSRDGKPHGSMQGAGGPVIAFGSVSG
jgi:hypothetical protein